MENVYEGNIKDKEDYIKILEETIQRIELSAQEEIEELKRKVNGIEV